MAPISHGRPSPRKTLTEFEPVTFPTAASAVSASLAAVIEAKVSGSEVPRATNVIAVVAYEIPKAQPNKLAASPTMAVTRPIMARAETKATQPFFILAGGTRAKNTYHPMAARWKKASEPVIMSISSFSLIVGCRIIAFLNW